jgi:hypothetical protein
VPARLSVTIADRIAAAGAQASQVRLAGRLPLPQAVLHQATNQAFVDALHSSYLIAAITILVATVLVAGLLGQKRPAIKTSVVSVGLRGATAVLASQGAVEQEVTE